MRNAFFKSPQSCAEIEVRAPDSSRPLARPPHGDERSDLPGRAASGLSAHPRNLFSAGNAEGTAVTETVKDKT